MNWQLGVVFFLLGISLTLIVVVSWSLYQANRRYKALTKTPPPLPLKHRAVVPVEVKWIWREADGTPCDSCREPALGKMLTANLTVGKTNRLTPLDLTLCRSCGTQIKSTI